MACTWAHAGPTPLARATSLLAERSASDAVDEVHAIGERLGDDGDYAQALEVHRLGLAWRTEHLTASDPDLAVSKGWVARSLRRLGREAEAIALYRNVHRRKVRARCGRGETRRLRCG